VKLFIWEGDRISSGYHDDGTLVVLAENEAQARKIARASYPKKVHEMDWSERSKILGDNPTNVWVDRWNSYYGEDGTGNTAINRPPDRIVELDTPCVVAFNGGGYD
jgi:hypothetical protein